MSDDLLKSAKNAIAVIGSFYEWIDRVENAGGTTCISGVAECHAMIASLKKNKPRLNELVIKPLQSAIDQAKEQAK